MNVFRRADAVTSFQFIMHRTYRCSISVAVLLAGIVTLAPAATGISLELPRIKSHGPLGGLPGVAKKKVSVVELDAAIGPGTNMAAKQDRSYVALAPQSDATYALRGSLKDVVFVSFLFYGAEGTTLDIGGAMLRVGPGARAGYSRLMVGQQSDVGPQWQETHVQAKIERYDGAEMAAFPVLTIRLDPVAGTWDLYAFNQLVAADILLPTATKNSDRRFSLHAGTAGAWLCGLVNSDENPLFADANANGVDDTFEKRQAGAILQATATRSEHSQLRQQWQQSQKGTPMKIWSVQRPQPDKS